MSQATTTHKTIVIQATVQRRWDCEELADLRERMTTEEGKQKMQQQRAQLERGEEVWVDCHGVSVAWVEEGRLRIGEIDYTLGELEGDAYHHRLTCGGCAMDIAYCRVNHTLRITSFSYEQLRRKAKAALLPDGAVIRFRSPFDFGGAGLHDTFRKAQYTHRIRKGGVTKAQISTVFYTLDGRGPYRIVNWPRLDWEVVSPSVVQQPS